MEALNRQDDFLGAAGAAGCPAAALTGQPGYPPLALFHALLLAR